MASILGKGIFIRKKTTPKFQRPENGQNYQNCSRPPQDSLEDGSPPLAAIASRQCQPNPLKAVAQYIVGHNHFRAGNHGKSRIPFAFQFSFLSASTNWAGSTSTDQKFSAKYFWGYKADLRVSGPLNCINRRLCIEIIRQ